jgi:hypothetical protein
MNCPKKIIGVQAKIFTDKIIMKLTSTPLLSPLSRGEIKGDILLVLPPPQEQPICSIISTT